MVHFRTLPSPSVSRPAPTGIRPLIVTGAQSGNRLVYVFW